MSSTLSSEVSPSYGSANPLPAIGQATIDAPSYNQAGTKLELEAKTVKTVDHAWNICKATEQNNRTRAARTADIQSLYDGEPPRSSAGNAERAKSWQSNASTGWLSGIVGRSTQRFINAVISQTYVTASSLPNSFPEAKTHTDLLRSKFTDLVRAWDGYTGILNAIAVENVLQGYGYAVFLDPYTYKPVMFKQDRAFCPEKAGQHARDLQFFVAKMDYRLDEFISLFKDEVAAKEVGYNLENCFFAANQATLADPREDATTTQFRKFIDMINEGVLGLSFVNSAERIVNCWLLFNREYDGQVSFWLIHRDSGKQLRFSFKLFKSMEDVLTMFSFEPGNGSIHSSKGIGRKLAALTIMKELFRNGIIDNSRMSGLTILQVDSADKSRFSPTVMAPFIFIDKSTAISEVQFESRADAYEVVDKQIDGWAEQTTGAYLAAQINDKGATEKTATEAQIDARREMEAADVQMRRWLDQVANMTQIQQLRAFSDQNIKVAKRLFEDLSEDPTKGDEEFYEGHEGIDPDCLRTLVEVLQAGVTEDEIRVWRKSPATIFAHISDAMIQQGIASVMQAFGQNPNIDLSKLTYKVVEGMVGAEVAKEIYIPDVNATLMAEQTRQQLIESTIMSQTGMDVPVSPRDNHILHGQTVQSMLTVAAKVLSTMQVTQQQMKAAELNLNHLGAHLAEAMKAGNNNPALAELDKFYAGFKKQLAQVVQIHAQAAAAEQAVIQKVQEGQAPGAGQPQIAAPAAQPQLDAPPQAPLQNATLPPGSPTPQVT